MFYNKIPETGGSVRSPLRDLYTTMVKDYIDGESTVIDGKLENHLYDYHGNRPWRSLLGDTLLLCEGGLVMEEEIPEYHERARTAVCLVIDGLCEYAKSYGLEFPPPFHDFLQDSIRATNLYKYKEFRQYCTLQRLVAESEVLKSNGELKSYYECTRSFVDDGVVHIYDQVVIVSWRRTKEYSIYPCEALQSMRDMLLKRAVALLLSETPLNKIGPGYPPRSLVTAVFEWGECVLQELGNEGYTTISDYEGLLTGTIIDNYDYKIHNNEFITEMMNGIEEKENIAITMATRKMLVEFDNLDEKQIIQSFALFKVWSYPIVDEEKAMSMLIKFGRCKKKIEPTILEVINCIQRRNFFVAYRHLHNTNPKNSVYKGDPQDHLYSVIMRNSRYDEDSVNYDMSHWANVKIQGGLDPIFDVDIGSYMKDKAISPHLTQLVNVYNKMYIPEEIKSEEGCRIRSGIEAYISEDMMTAKELIDYVELHGAEDAWKVVGVTAKEKELKPTARLFAMLVLHMKLWFAITEDCLKQALFKYFPQQSMDQTSTQSDRKKFRMALPTSPDSIKIVMNIDFSKWNTTFRDENTHVVFLFIDELFDFSNVYTYTHKFFESCRIYISSRHCIPEVLPLCMSVEDAISEETNCNTWFHGFLGGFEGQRQKGWTLVTLLFMIYVIEIEAGVLDYELYGQGDNQVLCIVYKKSELRPDILYPEEEDIESYEDVIKDKINELKSSLSRSCVMMGLKVKMEETWFSCNFFQYSKDFYINGAKMPLDMKQMMALSPHTNLIVPTQVQIFQTMTATVNACFDSSHCLTATYLLGLLLCGELILEHDQTYSLSCNYNLSKPHMVDELRGFDKIITNGGIDLLEMMMKVPSSLGGMCDMQMCNILRKGAGDHVESAVDVILRTECRKSVLYIAKLAGEGMQDKLNTDRSILALNPLSLNMKIIESGTKTLHQGTMDYLVETASGTIKEALTNYQSPEHKDFVKNLVPDKGFDPVLAQLMYSLSAYFPTTAQIDRLDGSTLNRLAYVSLSEFRRGVFDKNSGKIEHFIDLTTNNGEDVSELLELNSSLIAKTLRGYWYLDEYTVPISKYNPSFTLVCDSDRINMDYDEKPRSIMIKVLADYSSVPTSSRGPSKPISRRTNVPRSMTTNIEIVHGSVKNNMEKLADIYMGSVFGNEELEEQVLEQIRTVTNFDIEMAVDPSNTGRATLLETCSISSASNFQTHCQVFKSEEVKGETNEEIRFQHHKSIVMAVSLIEIHHMICSVTREIMDTTYWIKMEDGFEAIKRSNVPYSFVPSKLTYGQSSMYYAESTMTRYQNTPTRRKADSVLRCSMIVDMSLARSGVLEGTGITRSSVPFHILDEDVHVYCVIATLRYLMHHNLSLNVSHRDLADHVKGDKELFKAVVDMFRWHTTDEGCIRVIDSGVSSFMEIGTVPERSMFLLGYGIILARQIYDRSLLTFCRMFPLYEHTKEQFDCIFTRSMRFLLLEKCLIGPLFDCSLSNQEVCLNKLQFGYGCVMVNYGRAYKVIKALPKTMVFPALDYPPCVTMLSHEHSNRTIQTIYSRSSWLVALGLFNSSVSLVKDFGYEILLVCTNSSVMEHRPIITAYRNLLRGKNFHGKMNCTVVCYSTEEESRCTVHGPMSLDFYSKLSEKVSVPSACSRVSSKILHVGMLYDDPSGRDSLTYRKVNGSNNVYSVFCDFMNYTSQMAEFYPYLYESWTANMLIPDWALNVMMSKDLRSLLGNVGIPAQLTEQGIVELLSANNLYDEDDLVSMSSDRDLSQRVMRFAESFEDYRVWIMATRMNIISQEIVSRGGHRYVPSADPLMSIEDVDD